jgi:hypothetical protein
MDWKGPMVMQSRVWKYAAIALSVVVSAATARSADAQPAADPVAVEVRGGTASFDVGTNVPAVSVHGKSNAMEARGSWPSRPCTDGLEEGRP